MTASRVIGRSEVSTELLKRIQDRNKPFLDKICELSNISYQEILLSIVDYSLEELSEEGIRELALTLNSRFCVEFCEVWKELDKRKNIEKGFMALKRAMKSKEGL